MKARALTLFMIFFGFLSPCISQWDYLPDTVWLKSGEVVSCKIASFDEIENTITLQYHKEGVLAYRLIKLSDVQNYIIGPKNPFPEVPEASKSAKQLQDSLKSPKAYFSFGGGVPKNFGCSFTVILKNDWGGSINIKYVNYDRIDRSGNTRGLFGPGVIPGDELLEYSLCFVREFPSQSTKRVRFGLEAGPSLVKYEKVLSAEIHFTWLGSYYSPTTEEYITAGLAFRAKLEFPVSLAFGFELGLYGNINPLRPHGGIDIYITLGKVRDRLKPKAKK